ncbi:hypothetical protein Y032_0017g3335 [Ancylostoma ceylanicum]|uniref:Uncharacterized protein n=1 Tax=Ancylostoma ceylanicum TaxID=53326 RepID=A0A016V5X2_9BILA|nr:hypothetical protein Y032_0017g3335 [Ancylostoma ceylanicum]
MKTLVVILALCGLAYATNCPNLSEITKEDIDNVNTDSRTVDRAMGCGCCLLFSVALVTVSHAKGNVYKLNYAKYFDVTKTPPPTEYEHSRTLTIECGNKLEDFDYILGCKTETIDCKFARRYDKLTPEEKKLLKIEQ